jgi:DNA-binding NarL/FixJ family response regulator
MYILIADDHRLFRSGICALVQDAFPDVQVKHASSLEEVEEHMKSEISFQLMLIDLSMPGMAGARSIRKLSKLSSAPLMVVSAEESPSTIQACMQAGASGYVPKSASPEIMIQAMNSILVGGQYTPTEARHHKALKINFRQEKILCCLAKGYSNRQIAEQLELTEGTVKQYVSGILKLLNVDNRTQAGAKAKELLCLD